MDVKSEMKRLARLDGGPHPFCSLYLNTRWDNEQQRERIRLFVKNQLKGGSNQLREREAWRRGFLEDQEHIERYVEGVIRRVVEEGVNGLAVFSCSGKGVFLTYPSFIPFENEFFLSEAPILTPLVRLSSQYQNTLSVMVDTDSARLFELSLGGMMTESSFESYVPGRHDQGSWAQMRYQRHIKDHMDHHHKDVGESLTQLFDAGGWKRIILIGQDRILANFRAFLPERVRQHLTDEFSIDFSEERSKVLRRISERRLHREKENVSQEIQKLMERNPPAGRAAFGLIGTLEALNRGQIHTLYLLTSFSSLGGKCHQCGSLFLLHPKGDVSVFCLLCGGESTTVDLGEEIIRSVLRQDGDVKCIDDDPILKDHDGVAASLRFR